jgi:hypothetical protein
VNKAVADPGVLKDMARVAMTIWGDPTGLQKRQSKANPLKRNRPVR